MKIPPEQSVECPKCGVKAGAFCTNGRGRRMQTTHRLRQRLWKIQNGLITKGVRVGGRGPFVVPIHLTSDVCQHCHQPRSAHILVNNSATGMTSAAIGICPTSMFRSNVT